MSLSLPHLLFLPGLACDTEVWKHQTRCLTGITPVTVADYGTSDSIAEMARVALQRAPQRFAMVGHSMGGRVAYEVVRRAPERVLGVALLDTAYRGWVPGEAGERERAERLELVELARSQGMRVMARRWVQRMVHPARLSDERLIGAIVEMFARKTPAIFAAQINALLGRPDATPVLCGMRCPTMVLCGREDAWSLPAYHRKMAFLIPQSKFVMIENCGHMSPMERPAEVTAAMREWLEWVAEKSRGATPRAS
jgi:pimeloyl-ACP methyl ester carboxylesterase